MAVEGVGLALAVVGLFNDVINIFQYIQIGRALNQDAKTYSLQLMHVQLRFSRWGKAAGLSDLRADMNPAQIDLSSLKVSGDQLGLVEATLQQIMKLLRSAEAESALTTTTGGKEPPLAQDLNTITKALKKLSLGRRNITRPYTRMARWAIHGKDAFQHLLDSLQQLVSSLEMNFASPQEKQTMLVKEEVTKLGLQPQELSALEEFLRGDPADDEKFQVAVAEEAKKQNSGTTTNNTATFGKNYSGFQMAQGGNGNVFTFSSSGQKVADDDNDDDDDE